METQTESARNDLGTLAKDAGALMTATLDVAGQKVNEARRKLLSAMESGKEMCDRVREKTVDGVKVADQTVRNHPYQAIGIAIGVGALLGFLLARRA